MRVELKGSTPKRKIKDDKYHSREKEEMVYREYVACNIQAIAKQRRVSPRSRMKTVFYSIILQPRLSQI